MSDAKIKLTINDKAVEVKPGTTVFQAAQLAGIFIPHYCYHPDLSIAGVCRMCMVDIEKNPRLQISCNTMAAEGMVVKTDTEKVKDSVKGILELHLINHPLDCPICDKAGECKLQDYYVNHGLYESRMEFEKVHKPKVVDIGTIVLDSERCILCSRCVRFTAEVSKTHELGIFNRGDRAELRTYDHQPLRNDYTGNLADICPVGALTAKDFRFQQRVWFLEKVDTVCGMCARGCNTTVSVNPQTTKLYRIEPRRNPEVNASWMCDTGRWEFRYSTGETRLKTPVRRQDGKTHEVSWHEAFSELRGKLTQNPEKTLVAFSTFMTNEEIADAAEVFRGFGVKSFTWIVDETTVDDTTPFDAVLKHRDKTPNAAGFKRMMSHLKVPWLKADEAVTQLKSNHFEQAFLMGLEGVSMPGAAKLLLAIPKNTTTIVHATNQAAFFERAEWVLPNATTFEKSGSFVNALGILQKVQAAIPWQHLSRDCHAFSFGLMKGNDKTPSPTGQHQTVFQRHVSESIFPGVRLDWKRVGPVGVNIGEMAIREGVLSAKR